MAEVLMNSSPPIAENNQVGLSNKYNCEHCGKNYSSAASLKTHIKWHTGDLKHKCNYCEKKFRNGSELRRHEMVHTGERPNKCTLCEKQFIQKHALKDHLRKRHPSASQELLNDLSMTDSNDISFEDAMQQQQPQQTILTPQHHQDDASKKSYIGSLSLDGGGGEEGGRAGLACRFCQTEFKDEYLLLEHEEEEAREFQALHDSFEKKEFGELETFSLQEYLGHSDGHDAGGLVGDPGGDIKNNNNVDKLEYISIDLETLQSHMVPQMKLETSESPLDALNPQTVPNSQPLQLSNGPLQEDSAPLQLSTSSLQLSNGVPLQLSSGTQVQLSSGMPVQLSTGTPVQLSSGAPVQLSSATPVQLSSGMPVQLSSGSSLQLSNGAPLQLVASSSPYRQQVVLTHPQTSTPVQLKQDSVGEFQLKRSEPVILQQKTSQEPVILQHKTGQEHLILQQKLGPNSNTHYLSPAASAASNTPSTHSNLQSRVHAHQSIHSNSAATNVNAAVGANATAVAGSNVLLTTANDLNSSFGSGSVGGTLPSQARIVSATGTSAALSGGEGLSILSSLLSTSKPKPMTNKFIAKENNASPSTMTSSNSSGSALTVSLPSLPVPLRSIDPGKIPLNINRHSLNENGLPCSLPRPPLVDRQPDTIVSSATAGRSVVPDLVVSHTDLEFFHSLEKKYNYLDLKLGLPGTGPQLSNVASSSKCETDSLSSSCSSRSSSTPVDTILVSHVTQDQPRLPEQSVGGVTSGVVVGGGEGSGVALAEAQVASAQVVSLLPEQQQRRVLSLSELGLVHQSASASSTMKQLDQSSQPVEVVRLDPIQLPFAQKSRPAPVYAVKKELAGDEVTYAVSSEIKPDQAVKVEPTAFISMDNNFMKQEFKPEVQVQQSYIKTDQPQYVKTEQEYIKTEQVPALNKDQDIGAFCQGLLNEMDGSTWSQLNLADFQMNRSTGTTQTISLTGVMGEQADQQLTQSILVVNNPQQQQQQHHGGGEIHMYENTEFQLFNEDPVGEAGYQLNVTEGAGTHGLGQQAQEPGPEWTTKCKTIPKGWRIRLVDFMTGSKMKKRMHFMSPEGHVFNSRKEAIDFAVRTNAPEEDLATLRRGLKPKGPALEWKDGGPDVPEHWKVREILSSDNKLRTFYLSPGGLSFACRQAAYDHMVKVGTYSTGDVLLMRSGLKEKTLNALNRSTAVKPVDHATANPVVFAASPAAAAVAAPVAAVVQPPPTISFTSPTAAVSSSYAKEKLFKLGDPTLPPGWKNRLNSQGRENFRSPSGQFFHTRQSVVDYMIGENYPQDQIDLVASKIEKKSRRSGGGSGGGSSARPQKEWKENDPTVPAGWKMRQITTNEGLTITTFLTPEGVTIRGRKAALNHMLKTGLYTTEDVEVMRRYSNVLCKISDTWVSGDPSLPDGWRIRKYNSKPTSKRVHCDFLSPEHNVIRSRKGVLEHMRRTGGYTEADFRRVEAAQNRPERRKTEDMEPLPGHVPGTRIPYDVNRSAKVATAGAKSGASASAAACLAQAVSEAVGDIGMADGVGTAGQGNFSAAIDVTEQVSAVLGTTAAAADRTAAAGQIFEAGGNGGGDADAWQEANFLPTGWMERQGTWMSPDNQVFFSAAEVVNHLETSTNIPRMEVARMSRILLPSSTSLAPNQAKPTMSEHQTKNPAAALIGGTPTTATSEAGGSEQQIGRGWKLGPNLPKGWRIKTHFWGNREKHLFRSPGGKVFNSRKLAVEWIEATGCMPQEDLEKFKTGPRKRKKKENLWINGRRKSKAKRPSTDDATAETPKKPKKAKPVPVVATVGATDDSGVAVPPPARPKMATRNSGRQEAGKYGNILAGKNPQAKVQSCATTAAAAAAPDQEAAESLLLQEDVAAAEPLSATPTVMDLLSTIEDVSPLLAPKEAILPLTGEINSPLLPTKEEVTPTLPAAEDIAMPADEHSSCPPLEPQIPPSPTETLSTPPPPPVDVQPLPTPEFIPPAEIPQPLCENSVSIEPTVDISTAPVHETFATISAPHAVDMMLIDDLSASEDDLSGVGSFNPVAAGQSELFIRDELDKSLEEM